MCSGQASEGHVPDDLHPGGTKMSSDERVVFFPVDVMSSDATMKWKDDQ